MHKVFTVTRRPDIHPSLADNNTLSHSPRLVEVGPFVGMKHGLWLVDVTLLWLVGLNIHDDVIKWKHFPRYGPFVRGIHRWPVNSPHKGQWRGALLFSFICACINGWVSIREAGDLRRHHAHYSVIVMRDPFAMHGLERPLGISTVFIFYT